MFVSSGSGLDGDQHEARLHLLALCAIPGTSWNAIARAAQEPGGLERLLRAEQTERSREGDSTVKAIRSGIGDLASHVERARQEVAAAHETAGAKLVTVLDDEYPPNLRLIFNLPPFLFYRGRLEQSDARSVAVVGTRRGSDEGVRRAGKMSWTLVREGVAVVSGLAVGIDAAAHRAALDAGGRTIAVIGTGILKNYPAKNRALAEEIAERGAVVSQFWPTQPPSKISFPLRNITMSGLSQGTVVIEASNTSGAKMQARAALQHGKLAFLVDSLVTQQPWAQEYIARYPARALRIFDVQDVVDRLRSADNVIGVSTGRRQLTLELA